MRFSQLSSLLGIKSFNCDALQGGLSSLLGIGRKSHCAFDPTAAHNSPLNCWSILHRLGEIHLVFTSAPRRRSGLITPLPDLFPLHSRLMCALALEALGIEFAFGEANLQRRLRGLSGGSWQGLMIRIALPSAPDYFYRVLAPCKGGWESTRAWRH